MKTLTNAVRNYMFHCAHERNYSPHTIKAYRIDLNGFSQFVATLKRESDLFSLDKLTRDDLRGYLQSLGSGKPRTIRRKIACIRSFFCYLHRERFIAENIAEGWKCGIRIGSSLPRTLSRVAVSAILGKTYHPHGSRHKQSSPKKSKEAWKHVRTKALIEILYCTGMRVGEIASLQPTSVDLDSDAIVVHGKGNRERRIPIVTRELRSALHEWIQMRQKRHPQAAHFFVNRCGKKLGEQSIRAIVHQIGQSGAKLHVTPHMFRHTLATQLLEEGADLRHIQQLLGHSSITTTTIYVQVSDVSQRKCLQNHHPRKSFK
jgi:integrase/recombinase XerD